MSRRVMCSVAESILLYAAPTWCHSLRHKCNREMIHRVQRRAAIRVCSAYCVISLKAAQAIAGMIPIDLLAWKRAKRYDTKGTKNLLREETLDKSAERWGESRTKTLTKDLKGWVTRKHG